MVNQYMLKQGVNVVDGSSLGEGEASNNIGKEATFLLFIILG